MAYRIMETYQNETVILDVIFCSKDSCNMLWLLLFLTKSTSWQSACRTTWDGMWHLSFSYTTIFIFLGEWIVIHILHNIILFGFSNETTGFNYFIPPNLQIWLMNKSRHSTVHMCTKPSSWECRHWCAPCATILMNRLDLANSISLRCTVAVLFASCLLSIHQLFGNFRIWFHFIGSTVLIFSIH